MVGAQLPGLYEPEGYSKSSEPVSITSFRIQFLSVSALQLILDATERIAAHCESVSFCCSYTSRTARSFTSGENLFSLPMTCVISIWEVETTTGQGERNVRIIPIAMNLQGIRQPALERKIDDVFSTSGSDQVLLFDREKLLKEHIEPSLFRELNQRSQAKEATSYSTKLIAWIEGK